MLSKFLTPKFIHSKLLLNFTRFSLFFVLGLCAQCSIAQQNYCQHPIVRVAGQAEPVFIANRDRCSESDVPDSPAMAFINSNNQVVLFNGIAGSYPSIGPNLNQVKRTCSQPLFTKNPNRNAPPGAYFNYTWLRDPWTYDGKTIYALVHNEFHGWMTRPIEKYCPSRKMDRCIYFSIPAAKSVNGGQSFEMMRGPEGNVIPAIISPYPYQPDGGQQGMIQQSNVLSRNENGKTYFYILVLATHSGAQKRGVCLLRNDDISNPKTWRAWDGTGFNVAMNVSPHRDRNIDPSQHICEPVSKSLPADSWTYNTVLKEYISVGHVTLKNPGGERGEAFGYAVSSDMIHWSKPIAIQKVNWLIGYVRSRVNSGVVGQEYPSLLDPSSAGRNFEFSGAHPYLYYTHVPPKMAHVRGFGNRDLYREPLTITCGD